MRLRLHTLFQFRPRILTLIVFVGATAVIVLANLSYDYSRAGDGDVIHQSYGWPLIWHRVVLSSWEYFGYRAVGWYYSVPRLAANLTLWLVLLALLAGTCEWLLRRYRPRPRWSLRTLLVVVGLVAGVCGWFARARNRAAIQDPLIVSMKGSYGAPLVFVERSGPTWLDLLGMDRFRRRIVLANYWQLNAAEPGDEQRFLQLSRLSDVRYLTNFHVDELTPTMAKALGGMAHLQTLGIQLKRLTPGLPAALSDLRQLRSLSIDHDIFSIEEDRPADDDECGRLADECLAAIGTMTHLETLRLSNLPLRGASLACLGDLKNLKSLHVEFWNGEWKGSRNRKPIAEDCLRAIAGLKRTEWLELEDLRVSNASLACLAGLTELKTLKLDELVTDSRPMLAHLPPLPRLEALDLSESHIDDDDLRRLAVLPHLNSLRVGFYHGEPRFSPAGLAALASVESLEEVKLNGNSQSPEGIEALLAVKRLKRLHLSDMSTGPGDHSGNLVLDDGAELIVNNLERFRCALEVVRRSKRGIIIEKEGIQVFWRGRGNVMPHLDGDSAPERTSSWLPGGDAVWMPPLELTDYEKAGGRSSFAGASWPDRQGGRLITAEF